MSQLHTSPDTPQLIEHITKSIAWTVFDVKWVPETVRFVGLGAYARATGCMVVYEMNHGKLETVVEHEKKASFKCGTFGASSNDVAHLATGDFDGRLSIWDLEDAELPIYTVRAHEKIINAIDGCGGGTTNKGPPEIVTGGRDGCVRVWDPRQDDRPVASLEPEDATRARDCWSVAFGNSHTDEDRCVAAGYDNGDIKLFDLRTNTLRWETNIRNGVCGLQFDRKIVEMNKLVATCLESRFNLFDMRTMHPEEGYACLEEKAHESTVWCVRHLPSNRDVFMTTGGNGSLWLWKYKYPEQRRKQDSEGRSMGVVGSVDCLMKARVGDQPVSSFDWSPDRPGLCVMGGFDQCIRVGIVTKLNAL